MTVKIVKEINQEIVDYVANAINTLEEKRKKWCEDTITYDEFKKFSLKNVFNYVGGGCNGSVYEYKGYIVKFYAANDPYCKDGEMLDILNGSSFFPTVYAYADNFMIAEKINGINVSAYDRGRGLLSPLFKDHLEAAFKYADEKGVELNDLTEDNIMINEKGLPVIVDAGTFNVKGENIRLRFGSINECRQWVNSFMTKYSPIHMSTTTSIEWFKFDAVREIAVSLE